MAWRGVVGGTGVVEVGQDVGGSFGQGPGQCLDLLGPVGDGLLQGVDEPLHQVLSQARVLGAVGLDEALVDAPGGLDRGVAIISEEVLQALGLGIGEQTSPGQQSAPGPVEPVTCPAPPPCDRPLDPAAALIELAGRQGHDVKGIHDRPGLWELLAGGALEPGETVHGYHLDPPTPVLVALGEPGLEDLLGPARDHVQKPGRTTAVAYGGQVDDDGDIAVAPPGVAPHRGGTSRTGAKRAGESSTPRTSTPSKR